MGFTDLKDIEVLTLFEYDARMYAYRLKSIDKEYDMHLQAWINQQATATKENGKPYFSSFKDFYDYEKEIKAVVSTESKLTDKHRNMAQIAMKLNERR